MSNGMADRVAEALYLEHKQRNGLGRLWRGLPLHVRHEWRHKARAAIAAMREPNGAMKDASAET